MSEKKVKPISKLKDQDKPLIYLLREELFQLKSMNHFKQNKNK